MAMVKNRKNAKLQKLQQILFVLFSQGVHKSWIVSHLFLLGLLSTQGSAEDLGQAKRKDVLPISCNSLCLLAFT